MKVDWLMTFALPEESADLRRRLGMRGRAEVGRLMAESGLGLFHTGMGGEGAAERLRECLRQARPVGILSSGFAAGLRSELEVGDLVMSTDYVLPAEWRSGWRARMREVGLRVYEGGWETVADPVETVKAKQRLAKASGALVVEMETGYLAGVAKEAGIPFHAVRSVSDGVGEALPVPLAAWFDMTRQRPRVLGLLGWLASHPAKIPAFVGFVRGVGKAGRSLGELGVWLRSQMESGA